MSAKPGRDASRDLRMEQLREVLRLHLFRIAGNIAVSGLVFWECFGGRLGPRSVFWFALMLGAALSDVTFYALVRRRGVSTATIDRFTKLSIAANAAYGTVWGIGMVLLFPHADTSGQTHLSIITAAMLCTAPFVLSSMPRGVLAFSGPLLIGASAAMAMDFGQEHYFEFGLLAVYVMVFPFGLRQHTRVFRERVEALVKLEERNHMVRLLLNDFETSASDWLWRTDKSHRIVMLSPTFAERAGIAPEEIADLSIAEFIRRFVTADPVHAAAAEQAFLNGAPFRDAVARITIGGATRWWELTGAPARSATGGFLGFHGVGRDVTARIEAERQLRHVAHHDLLTGVRNRAAFQDELKASAARAAAGENASVLALVDLDRFKQVNDTAGHAAGDDVLREACRRLREAMPRGTVVARIGGDEFAAIFPGGDIAEARRAVERAVAAIARPIKLKTGVFSIGASAGLAAMPSMGVEPEAILRLADTALYAAKAAGKGRALVASKRQIESIAERARLDAELPGAIERDEFGMAYQPVVEAGSGRIVGLEAFMRWRHPELGAVPPAVFLALAEKSGAYVALGRLTLDAACRQAALLPEGLSVAINFSPRQFASNDLFAAAVANLKTHGLAAGRIEIEIGEEALGDGAALANVRRYRDAGFGVVFDDFGAGASSFTALCEAPFSKIKIDHELVARLENDDNARAAVRSIASIGHSLGLVVSAEGVESAAAADYLRSVACPLLQGYHFAPAMPPEDLPAWLLAETARTGKDKRAAA